MRCHTTLRPATEADLDVLSEIRNDIELQLLLMASPRPNTTAQVRSWIDRRTTDSTGVFFVVADQDGEALGFVQLTEIDFQHGHARMGIALASRHQGLGHGRRAVEAIARYARDVMGLRKIILDVRADNERARAMYENCGFTDVGCFRSHFRAGQHWVDVEVMERLLDGGADR